jgi:hypothetical protein
MNMETALLAILTTLVAAMIWVVKALMTRSDRILDSRDTQIGRALDELAKAIDGFKRVEAREDQVHDALLLHMKELSQDHSDMTGRIEAMIVVQKQLVQLSDRLVAGLDRIQP